MPSFTPPLSRCPSCLAQWQGRSCPSCGWGTPLRAPRGEAKRPSGVFPVKNEGRWSEPTFAFERGDTYESLGFTVSE